MQMAAADWQRVIAVFLERFPDHGWFVEELYRQFPRSGAGPLRAVLGLAELYSHDALLAAFAAARTYTTYTQAFLRGVLDGGAVRSAQAPGASSGTVPECRPGAAVCGDLQVYQRVLEGAR